MFADFKELLKEYVFNRLTLMIIVFAALAAILVQRLFTLQIVNGEEYLNNFTLTIKKENTLKSIRGNIYDRNGELLAYNKLAYSVTIEDNFESGKNKNANMNDSIYRAIKIIESCDDDVNSEFNIIINDSDEFEYTLTGTRLYRFIADVYGRKKIDDLKTDEKNSTPDELMAYLCSKDKYAIGQYTYDLDGNRDFIPMAGLTKEEILQLVSIRYDLSTNSYQKYLKTVISDNVSDETVAAIMENKADLQGIDVEENTLRVYNDSKYFAHIVGYTGYASTEDLEELAGSSHDYKSIDMVGKSGIEKSMEEYLQGSKGKNVIYVDNVGKVIETLEHVDPTAGNDVYLSIDSNLQKAVYNMLEQKLAGILVSKIVNSKTYNNSVVKSSLMMIPINDVYYAFINNNIIDLDHMAGRYAMEYERLVHSAFLQRQAVVMNNLRSELMEKKTPYKELDDEYKVYESNIVTRLMSNTTGVIRSDLVDRNDEVYLDWAVNETISLNEYLHYCLKMNWIDITKFHLESRYSDSEEIYSQLVDYIIDDISSYNTFSKKIYKYMIGDDSVTGRELCMILYEQKVLYGTSMEKRALESGAKTAYDFVINKIANLEITPDMLALDPCSGSCVVTKTNGEVLALVTYPGYDNNKMANTIDSDYYARLLADNSAPLYNNATQQMTAPGSTFKPISSAAALEEGMVNIGETINCQGVYEYLDTTKQCWVYPGGHGNLDVANAIGNSCNCFFYEVGFRFATNLRTSVYDEQLGLDRLKKYADIFGLTSKTGIEMEENEPEYSKNLPVDTAIGQGSNNYTTIGLSRYVTTLANKGTCYDFTLVDKVVSQNGDFVIDYSPKIKNQVTFNPSTWDQIYSGMRIVIEKAASFRDYPINVAGKTGTAQTSKSRTNHALFIGFAPYENPEMTVAIRIAYGYTSANAAKLASDVISYYFNLEESDELLSGIADAPSSEIIED